MGPEIETLIKDYAIGTVALVSGSSGWLQKEDLRNTHMLKCRCSQSPDSRFD